MAIAYDNVSGQNFGGSGSFDHTTGTLAHGIAFGFVYTNGSLSTVSCTYNGQSLTQLYLGSRLWVGYLLDPPSGTNAVAFTVSGSGAHAFDFITYQNVSTNPPTLLNGTSAISTSYSDSSSISATDMRIVACGVNNISSFTGTPSDYTGRANRSSSAYSGLYDKINGGTATYSWSGTENYGGAAIKLSEYVPNAGQVIMF